MSSHSRCIAFFSPWTVNADQLFSAFLPPRRSVYFIGRWRNARPRKSEVKATLSMT
jgi:hypothetical protein